MGNSNAIEAVKSTVDYKVLKMKNSTDGGLLNAENSEKGALLPQSMSMAKHDMHTIKAMQQKKYSADQLQLSRLEKKDETENQAMVRSQEVEKALTTHFKPVKSIIERHLQENFKTDPKLKDNIYVAIVKKKDGSIESQVVKKAEAKLQLFKSAQKNKNKPDFSKSLDYHIAEDFSLQTPNQPVYQTLKNKIDSYLKEQRSSVFIDEARKQHQASLLSELLHKNSHNFLA